METETEKQIREIRERANKREFNLKRNRAKSRVTQVEEDAKFFYRFWLQLVATVFWIWNKILRPVSNLAWRFGFWFFGLYRKAWSFVVYKRNEYGDLIFSKFRAAAFLIFAVPVSLFTLNLFIDGSIFAATYRNNETVYLFNATDNSFTNDDEFSIIGCEVTAIKEDEGFQCDSQYTLYFRVQPGLIEHIYAIFTKGDIFYADSVAAVVAPGWNKCTVDSWYIRFRTLMRNTNIYPKMLDASCRPIFQGN